MTTLRINAIMSDENNLGEQTTPIHNPVSIQENVPCAPVKKPRIKKAKVMDIEPMVDLDLDKELDAQEPEKKRRRKTKVQDYP